MSVVKYWVDELFAAHKDTNGQTGSTMSMGQGCIISVSRKQNMNTRSLTESEFVGSDDDMP